MTITGEREAFERRIDQLYHSHSGWLRGWLRRRLDCSHSAEDLTQDTFMRLLTARDRGGVLAVREPRAYLSTVAGRLLVNHYRRLSLERTYKETLALLPPEQAPSPEWRLALLETLQEVDALLDRLPEQVRTAFLLSQLEGLTYAAIAEHLAVSERTVKRYMARALEECILLMD
ncbi:RNA polymerase sigma-70 factor, ECF subfamily [Alloalcanivorax dieselolei B5]|uniref:RNA polymerase sigma-70 factor, ECF subfamily n=1 Tax=Alcanivorax dieselolei (strain DSM 16502 / CGMCC 1.3690 / MCCC 1A00001 / B-5) TaxID=930169 RepID=K0CKP8_ALCDB|nr:sigma-70 family RNA polymerase sigma factor [Alloalcanivorax dieselolei]AFT72277.1 RNA polymerase sigma-70 factor, ECF subfamily [Alloalcanivorax dieselolei B5]GGJ76686.1 ECF sigma factor FemI [Alloalcanivorax dieselolei]